MRTPLTRIVSIVAVASLSSVATPIHGQQGATPLPAAACASLQGMSIPALAIGLPTGGAVVQTAVAVAAIAKGNPNGDFCKVTGIVKPKNPSSPNLEFEVNLPAAWNRRALQMGGGGYNGTLVTGLTGFTLQPANVDNPLKQGFVTLGTDGGHKSAAGFDGSFAMDDEALAQLRQGVGEEGARRRDRDHQEGVRPRTRAVLFHRRLAGRSRGARCGRALFRTTTTASSRTIPRTTSRCCTWDRSMPAARCTRAAARRG